MYWKGSQYIQIAMDNMQSGSWKPVFFLQNPTIVLFGSWNCGKNSYTFLCYIYFFLLFSDLRQSAEYRILTKRIFWKEKVSKNFIERT